jgi:hypothetical protein
MVENVNTAVRSESATSVRRRQKPEIQISTTLPRPDEARNKFSLSMSGFTLSENEEWKWNQSKEGKVALSNKNKYIYSLTFLSVGLSPSACVP